MGTSPHHEPHWPAGFDVGGTGELVLLTSAQQQSEIVLAGGSGFGDPWERDRNAVELDLAMGWVMQRGAENDYGFRFPGIRRPDDAEFETHEREHW